jgi:mannitol 2-dehydrogenase
MTVLSSATAHLTKSPLPLYDRSQVTPGIMHFGFGAFHRAHQAEYLDALMNRGKSLDWGIVGVGVLPQDKRMHEVMQAQDCLYTRIQKRFDGTWNDRVIGSVIEHLHAPDDPAAVVERLADPRIRIVSLTITEGGYEHDPATGEFTPTSGPVLADLASLGSGAMPTSVFGFLLSGLRLRYERGLPPFAVLSCDNIQNNGQIAQRSLVAFTHRIDPRLAEIIEHNVAFPGTMVDRITPITTVTDRIRVSELLGVEDGWPVVCEPFTQWVIEDRFPWGRPPLEHVGVQFVKDVTPYETMKLRLLNASHQALAYPSLLLGLELVHEAVRNDSILRLLTGYMGEARATVPPVAGINLDAYCTTLLERFGNPEIRDTIARLAMDAENRIATFLVPVIRDLLRSERSIRFSAIVIAAYLHTEHAGSTKEQIIQALKESNAFEDLNTNPAFINAVTDASQNVHDHGIETAIALQAHHVEAGP